MATQITNQELYDFYREIDRSLFLEGEYKAYADYDTPLPIGHEQTISQPSLVLEMTMQLGLNSEFKVLEIGTGSGFQTAFLAHFVKGVYTIERIRDLSIKAQERLQHLGYTNIHFKIDDGSHGWSEHAPFDRIIVTAGAGDLPEALVQQLRPLGKMVVPVGHKGPQDLLVVTKLEDGSITKESLGPVRFVEFKGKYGWKQ